MRDVQASGVRLATVDMETELEASEAMVDNSARRRALDELFQSVLRLEHPKRNARLAQGA